MAEIQFQILSDLHLEAPAAYDVFTITPKAPFLALLGDIGYVKDSGFFEFLQQQLKNFRLVFFLLGNHEPYHSDWAETKTKLNRFRDDMNKSFQMNELLGELVFLDQTRYDVSSTVTVLGCTLFSTVIPEQIETVSFGLNDFYHIKDWSIELHQQAHSEDLNWLNSQVESIARLEPHRKIVIFTHYSPCTQEPAVDPAHAGSSISSGFATDLSNEICWTDSSVKIWAFGHTHFNCDFEDLKGGKRVVTNQRGYYFSQAARFDEEKLVCI
ncbi:hypothetical protein FQN54_001071 [Arachnomyces sp. PD_36]|nr:hypothetical protein FQN54_001071 [Arachnomyces sp. PD_36]